MKRLVILFIVLVSALMPGFCSQVAAQEVMGPGTLGPATRPRAGQTSTFGAPESSPPQDGLEVNYRRLYFAPRERPLAARHSMFFSDKYSDNDSLTEFATAVMATRRNKFTLAPIGMMMDSGLSYALPVSKHFDAFASLQPSLMYTVASPQTIWAAGLRIPIASRVDAGQDLSLKLATAVDQQYRPIFFLSLNLMSLGRK